MDVIQEIFTLLGDILIMICFVPLLSDSAGLRLSPWRQPLLKPPQATNAVTTSLRGGKMGGLPSEPPKPDAKALGPKLKTILHRI